MDTSSASPRDTFANKLTAAAKDDTDYRNVGSDEPYELPAEDADVRVKEDVRQKRTRYGRLQSKPNIA